MNNFKSQELKIINEIKKYYNNIIPNLDINIIDYLDQIVSFNEIIFNTICECVNIITAYNEQKIIVKQKNIINKKNINDFDINCIPQYCYESLIGFILKKISTQHIVTYYGVYYGYSNKLDQNKYFSQYILMENLDENLEEYIKIYSNDLILILAFQAFIGLCYYKKYIGFNHLDICKDNMMIKNSNITPKYIIDNNLYELKTHKILKFIDFENSSYNMQNNHKDNIYDFNSLINSFFGINTYLNNKILEIYDIDFINENINPTYNVFVRNIIIKYINIGYLEKIKSNSIHNALNFDILL